jgi:peptidoglycan/LPS O-acetylase OafA/YrhL
LNSCFEQIGGGGASGRVPHLDGLRALAIGLVMGYHALGSQGMPGWLKVLERFYSICDLGALGVHIFFVISGFIITHLLLREEKVLGTPSLKDFWIRRAFRILPALCVFLTGVWFLSSMEAGIETKPVEYLMALTFTQHLISDQSSWWIGHTWSLSIEEQFYLLWPLIFVLMAKSRIKILLIWMLVIMPVTAVVVSLWLPLKAPWIMPVHQGFIACGCLMALLRGPLTGMLKPFPVWLIVMVAAVFIILPRQMERVPQLRQLVDALGSIIGGIGITALLVTLLDNRLPVLGRLLENRGTKWIGRLSYSLYLWQQLFLGSFGTQSWQRFPVNVILAVFAAAVSYYVIEMPFLRLRVRMLSPGR